MNGRPGPSAVHVSRAAQLAGLTVGVVMAEIHAGRILGTRFAAGWYVSDASLADLRALAEKRQRERGTVTLKVMRSSTAHQSQTPEVSMDQSLKHARKPAQDPAAHTAAMAELARLCEGQNASTRTAIGQGFRDLVQGGKTETEAVEVMRAALAYNPGAELDKLAKAIVASLPKDEAPPAAVDAEVRAVLDSLPREA